MQIIVKIDRCDRTQYFNYIEQYIKVINQTKPNVRKKQ